MKRTRHNHNKTTDVRRTESGLPYEERWPKGDVEQMSWIAERAAYWMDKVRELADDELVRDPGNDDLQQRRDSANVAAVGLDLFVDYVNGGDRGKAASLRYDLAECETEDESFAEIDEYNRHARDKRRHIQEAIAALRTVKVGNAADAFAATAHRPAA